MSWNDFLRQSHSSDHAVQIYSRLDELAESVGAYLTAGFDEGAPGVVVARPGHWESFAEALARHGWDASHAEAQGLLTVADAGTTLASFMDGSKLSPIRFEQVVGGLLDRVAAGHPGARIRAFGEMVDLLCQRGEHEAALELEELWNELARTRNFSLLCGYRLDVFDRSAQVSALPGVCDTHSHVLPAADPVRLARAVDRALNEVLGPAEAGDIYVSVGQQVSDKHVPVPQLILAWVSAQLPAVADRVLTAARSHYERPPALQRG